MSAWHGNDLERKGFGKGPPGMGFPTCSGLRPGSTDRAVGAVELRSRPGVGILLTKASISDRRLFHLDQLRGTSDHELGWRSF